MAQQSQGIHVRLEGLRPLMFDRYAGDNNTQLPPAERMYLTPEDRLTFPALNLFSLLAAENTKSVCRQFFGKSGKTIALGISSYTTIEPFDILIHDDDGPVVFTTWNAQISIHNAVARLPKGIPNPKTRPVLALPWHIDFDVQYQENRYCTLADVLFWVVAVPFWVLMAFSGRVGTGSMMIVLLWLGLRCDWNWWRWTRKGTPA